MFDILCQYLYNKLLCASEGESFAIGVYIKELVELTTEVMTNERVRELPLDESSKEFMELEALVGNIGSKLTRKTVQERLLKEFIRPELKAAAAKAKKQLDTRPEQLAMARKQEVLLRYLILNNHVPPQQVGRFLKRDNTRLMLQLVRQWNEAERSVG